MLGAIDRDEIEMAVHLPHKAAELFRIFAGRIHILDEDVLEGHAAARLLEVPVRSCDDIFDLEMTARWQDSVADRVIRRMEGDRKRDRETFCGESIDHRHDAAGGERDISEADIQQPRIAHKADETKHFIIVRERLARPHQDDRVDRRIEKFSEGVNLSKDLARGEIPFQSISGRGAENAAHRTAHLRGDADGIPVDMVHADCLNEGTIGELHEELGRITVIRCDMAHDHRLLEDGILFQPFPHRPRQLGHIVKRKNIAAIQVVLQLLGSKFREAMACDPCFHFGETVSPDIPGHRGSFHSIRDEKYRRCRPTPPTASSISPRRIHRSVLDLARW